MNLHLSSRQPMLSLDAQIRSVYPAFNMSGSGGGDKVKLAARVP